MPNYTFKQNGSNIEVYQNGVRIATTTPAQAQLAYGYGSTPTQTSTPSSPTQSGTGGAGAAATGMATKPSIPESVYQQLTQAVVNGTATPDQAKQNIQQLISTGSFSDTSVDANKLFPQGQTFTKSDGSTVVQFDPNGNLVNRGGGTSTSGLAYDNSWTKYGVTQDVWNKMSPTQQGVVAASMSVAASQYASTGSKITLSDALARAATDPNLMAKYSDALKLDTQAFQQSLQQLQVATSTTAQQQQTQFENDRRQLAAASEAAGQAYSGFRGRAEQQLGQNESAIVTSSRAAAQSKINDLTTQMESKYGSAATTAATLPFVNPFTSSGVSLSGLDTGVSSPQTETLAGSLSGGITGSQPVQKQADILNLASNYVTLGQTPPVVPA